MTLSSCVLLDFLCMDGDEVTTATMCPTTQCTTCSCPQDLLDSTKDTSLFVIQLRCAVSCKRNVNGCLIPTGRLVIDARKRYSIYRLYSCHMTTSFHLYTDTILVISWRLHSIYIPTLLFGQVKTVKDAEQRLLHKLLPSNAWMKVADFRVLTSCPKDKLHQWFIGLYSEHIMVVVLTTFHSTWSSSAPLRICTCIWQVQWSPVEW